MEAVLRLTFMCGATSGIPKSAIIVGVASLLAGILINNSGLSDLQRSMDHRFDDLIRLFDTRFNELDQKLDRLG
ncbi:MAG: hypothetical protein ABSB35_39840 [Bryobacteraceae bacterium]